MLASTCLYSLYAWLMIVTQLKSEGSAAATATGSVAKRRVSFIDIFLIYSNDVVVRPRRRNRFVVFYSVVDGRCYRFQLVKRLIRPCSLCWSVICTRLVYWWRAPISTVPWLCSSMPDSLCFPVASDVFLLRYPSFKRLRSWFLHRVVCLSVVCLSRACR